MLTMKDLDPLLRHRSTVVTGDADRVGSVGVVYLDDADDRPTWVTVHTGLFGARESFVPLEGASVQGRDLVVAYPRDLIRHAPSVDRDGHLSPEEEAALYQHYGLHRVAPARRPAATSTTTTAPAARIIPEAQAQAQAQAPTVEPPAPAPAATPEPTVEPAAATPEPTVPTPTPTPAPAGPAAGGTSTHDEGGTPWVVRSEERLRVGTEQYEAARVRLRKYVVTEEATVTVPLEREELRIEVEPVTSSSYDDGDVPFQEQTIELRAREEHAVVGKETVAVERVSMRTVEVTGRATVREEVRKERITGSVDGPGAPAKLLTPTTGTGGTDTDAASRIATKNTNVLLKGGKKRR